MVNCKRQFKPNSELRIHNSEFRNQNLKLTISQYFMQKKDIPSDSNI